MLSRTPRETLAPTSLAPWTSDPRAAAILADIARNPIQPTRHFETYAITREEWTRYDDPRVTKLEGICNEHLLAIDAAAAAHDCPALYDAFAAEPTVQQAVEAACAKASKLRLVEGRAA